MHSFLRSSVATPHAGHPSLTKASLMSCQYTWNAASSTEAFSAWPYTAFLKYFTQAMSASVLISVAGGSASHPAAGGLYPCEMAFGIPRNKGVNFHGKFGLGIPRNS